MIKHLAKQTLLYASPQTLCLSRAIRSLFLENSYFHVTGWMTSFQKDYPCRLDGTPLPWMNYSVISFLEGRLTKSMNCFEYGSGFSTLFFENLVNSVTSVEHDQNWFDKVKELTKDKENIQLIFRPLSDELSRDEYIDSILESGEKYDVIVIDGKLRDSCLRKSLDAASESGVIILDDSQRGEYTSSVKFLLEKGFQKIDFEGLKPTDHRLSKTSILYKRSNCFGI